MTAGKTERAATIWYEHSYTMVVSIYEEEGKWIITRKLQDGTVADAGIAPQTTRQKALDAIATAWKSPPWVLSWEVEDSGPQGVIDQRGDWVSLGA